MSESSSDQTETLQRYGLILGRWRRLLTEIASGDLDPYDAEDDVQRALNLVCEVPTCYQRPAERSRLCDDHRTLYRDEYSPGDDTPAGEQMVAYGAFLREMA